MITCAQFKYKQYINDINIRECLLGFICVTAISTPEETYVVDCLNENSKCAPNVIGRLLTNQDVLKVFCGGDQDMIRTKKEWNCFTVAFVDLQDMFRVWRRQDSFGCFNECREALRNRIPGSKCGSTVEAGLQAEFLTYNNPGLGFLMNVFLPGCMKKDPKATLADFRKRPLHPDLITYSANDATATLAIFTKVALKVN